MTKLCCCAHNKRSAVAEMAAQCGTSWIFAFEWGYLSFNPLFFYNLWECHHKLYVAKNWVLWVTFCCRHYGSDFSHFYEICPKVTEFGKM